MTWQIGNYDLHFPTNFRYSKYIVNYKICSLVSKAQYLHHTSTAKKKHLRWIYHDSQKVNIYPVNANNAEKETSNVT